jgi:hypothetical protein
MVAMMTGVFMVPFGIVMMGRTEIVFAFISASFDLNPYLHPRVQHHQTIQDQLSNSLTKGKDRATGPHRFSVTELFLKLPEFSLWAKVGQRSWQF